MFAVLLGEDDGGSLVDDLAVDPTVNKEVNGKDVLPTTGKHSYYMKTAPFIFIQTD